VIDSCPPLNIALRSTSTILSNEHLLTNFATHFLPFKEHDGRFPLIDCSKLSDLPQDIIKYASIILFTILHKLGHWTFHYFSCALDHDLATPKGVLMEEAGEAVEFLMFGFKIQHYGPQEPKYMVTYGGLVID
ncbi:unnamed protein product, partial [Rotaria magnacalcarata]